MRGALNSVLTGYDPSKWAVRFLESWDIQLPDDTQDLAMWDELVKLIDDAYVQGYTDCEDAHDWN